MTENEGDRLNRRRYAQTVERGIRMAIAGIKTEIPDWLLPVSKFSTL